MLKLGILDFDTSHCVQFTKRLNHVGIEENQWVDGARVVIGCPGSSRVSPERIPGFIKTLREDLAIPLVDKPAEMLGKIDAVLIESNDGAVHLERARPFLEAGVPCFIDKPFAASVRDAEAMAELAARKNVPIFSSSSMRFALEVGALHAAREELGAPVAVDVYGVQHIQAGTSGWFFYGMHAVELLYGILGPGFTSLKYTAAGLAEHASGPWKSGALASVTVIQKGDAPFGFTYFGEKKTRAARLDSAFVYRELLKRMVAFFQTGKPPVPIEETIEIVRYLEAVSEAVKK